MELTPQQLEEAFWEALNRCGDDDRVHDMDYPWHNRPKIDGDLPQPIWEHMLTVLTEATQ